MSRDHWPKDFPRDVERREDWNGYGNAFYAVYSGSDEPSDIDIARAKCKALGHQMRTFYPEDEPNVMRPSRGPQRVYCPACKFYYDHP
jgi:hypothetical protein